MRPHPIAALAAAVLSCSALAACSSPEEEGAGAQPQAGSAAVPEAEADASSSPESEPDSEEEAPPTAPVGWAGEPMEDDGQEHPGAVGGAGGDTVTASDADELADHLAAEEPLVIEVSGEITLSGAVEVGSDKTLMGVDGGAELTGGHLVVDGSDNVVLSNLGIRAEGTALFVRGGAHHVWVDGSTFSGSEDDEPLVAVTGGADHLTLSWNHFLEASSALSVGGGEEEPGALRATVHHNYFDGTAGHQPDVRFAEHVHVFNNYYRANSEYGVRSADDANVLVEGNYFEGTQVSVSTGEEPGNVVTRDNLLVDSAQPDLRGEVADPPYAYELDETVSVPDTVSERAGVS